MRVFLFRCACVLVLVSIGSAAHAGQTLDDFENGTANWNLDLGVPAAKGSLTSGAGHPGIGAHLSYDFSAGGSVVGMKFNLPQPTMAPGIAFWVRSPAGVRVVLKATDGGGQTLTYLLNRPLEVGDAASWYEHVVELDAPTQFSVDGVVHGGIQAIELLASVQESIATPAQSTLSGAVDFDELATVDSLSFDFDPMGMVDTPAQADQANLRSRLGVNTHFTSDDKALDAAQAAGMGWVGSGRISPGPSSRR